MRLKNVRMSWGDTFAEVIVEFANYGNGDIAILLYSDEGELLSTPTVNLEAYGLRPERGSVYVKNYSEGEGMLEVLTKGGIVEPGARMEAFGPFDTTASEARLSEAARAEIGGF